MHFKFDQRTSHIIVTSLLRFGFRFLEKDEDARKDVEERNLGIQEVKEKNQTASKESQNETRKNMKDGWPWI